MMEPDLTVSDDVVELMKSSKNVEEWNSNCDIVKKYNGGTYPKFWYTAIILSGVVSEWNAKHC